MQCDRRGAGILYLVLARQRANHLQISQTEAASARLQLQIVNRPVARECVGSFGVRAKTTSASNGCSAKTLGTPGFSIPAFSAAICASVLPRNC